ncbi:MAG: DUF2971 domain-containing protein [Janthinobacterium lividum]
MIKVIPTPYGGQKEIEVFIPKIAHNSAGTLPKVLYKYRDWDSDYNKRILTDLEIWLSAPKEFNDPFDCKIPYDYDLLGNENTRRAYFTQTQDELVKNGYKLPAKNADSSVDSSIEWFVKNFKPEMIDAKGAIGIQDKMVQSIGLYCTTPLNDNILMWAHYAKNSTGFCIGLDTEILMSMESEIFQACIQIKYLETTNIPKVNPLDNFEDRTQKTCCVKFGIWSYEREYRFIVLSPEHRLVTILPKHIHSVVLGSAMTAENKHEIKQVLNKDRFRHVRLFQAEQSNSSFVLNITEISKNI